MTHTDPLHELSDALSVAPSPEFAARVRQHIAVTPVRPDLSLLRGFAAAAVVVLIASALVARWPQPTDRAATSVPAPGVSSAASATPAASVPVTTRPLVPVRTPATRVVATSQPVAHVTTEMPFAETLVPDDQRLALVRLLGSIRAGRATVPDHIVDEVVDDEGRWAPRALVIEPLKVQPIK